MTDTQQSAQGFRKALAVFEQHAPDILEVDLTIRGKPMRADLHSHLSLGDYHDDPSAMSLMADKLPALLVFYGIALIEAQEQEAALEEELELFVQEKWQDILEALTRRIDALCAINEDGSPGPKIIGGLKKAPTTEGIRAAIINENKHVWDDLNARKVATSRSVKVLENICRGLEKRIQLLNSQFQVMGGMVRQGISRT